MAAGAATAGGRRPNVVLVFGDQWRAQATGYAGNPVVRTPHLDALAAASVDFVHAVSGCPVCSPARASLLTGQYPLAHGVFVNDVYLRPCAHSMARVFAAAGYDTAYIGKWHVDGHGRSAYIPPERRQGFAYWKALECTHDYGHSGYYSGNSEQKQYWAGYDAASQTRDAQAYIAARGRQRPFLLVLSWGPPHEPYETAPAEFRQLYAPDRLAVPPNVPPVRQAAARRELAGYYAHCTALDACLGELRRTLAETGQADNTILVFFSDHGDMLGAQGHEKKQQPWEESVRVPFLLHWPALGPGGRRLDAPIDMPDVLPTLLGLCGLPVPAAVQGIDFSALIRGGPDPSDGAALLSCIHPFGQWWTGRGGREFRGLRTRRYTYARSLAGPWLLYDNQADPHQRRNLVGDERHSALLAALDAWLVRRLEAIGDEFLAGGCYLQRWGYRTDARGTVPYTE